jgi:hypothetical protein
VSRDLNLTSRNVSLYLYPLVTAAICSRLLPLVFALLRPRRGPVNRYDALRAPMTIASIIASAKVGSIGPGLPQGASSTTHSNTRYANTASSWWCTCRLSAPKR